MGKLSKKVAIITGASRGIGSQIALEFAKEGASVVINYSKDDNGADEIIEKIKKEYSGIAIKIKKDISKYDECEILVMETIKHFGKIDILVNNAGISKIGLLLDVTKEDIDEIVGVNLLSSIYLSKFVLPHMINRGGVILNTSSMWGECGASCEVLYSATKGGINLLTKSLAKEMAMSNVRVNAIAPGVIDTKMNSFLSDEDRKSLEEEIPMGRFGKVDEVAKTAVFLCSDDASYITGQIIRIDGGFV